MSEDRKAMRQGEIMLVPVTDIKDIPEGVTSKRDSYIVGHSESGHHHVLESRQMEITETDTHDIYIRLFEPGRLVHQKMTDTHRTLRIPAGIYQRFTDTEYDPFEGILRPVQD
jgi:hypothetical protein